MKRLSLLFLALSLAALSPQDAWAQRGTTRGRGGPGGFNPLGLLTQKSVQEELKLTPQQVENVTATMEKLRPAPGEFQDLGRDEQRAKLAERRKAGQEALAKILKEDQLKRFNQIALQQRGPQALADPETATALNLSDDQKQKIETIAQALRDEMRGLFDAGADADRDLARKKMEDLRIATNEKLQALLTPEQQAKWKELTGEPFKGQIERGQFRGNRRGRDAGGRRGGPPDGDSKASTALGAFRLAGFRADDDDDDKAKAKKDGEKKRDGEKAKAKKDKGDKAKGKHAEAERRHANRGHGHHVHRGHQAGRGPHAEIWNRVARAVGDGPRTPHQYARFHGRGPTSWGDGPGGRGPSWGQRREHQHGHGPAFADHPRHRGHFGPMMPMHGFGPHPGRGPEFAHHDGRHDHGPAHFASHRGPQFPGHHFASWRGHHGRGPMHFERARENDRRGPPAPPRMRDDRRDNNDRRDSNDRRDNRDGCDGAELINPSPPSDRLAQLERSLDRLARQIETLRQELRR